MTSNTPGRKEPDDMTRAEIEAAWATVSGTETIEQFVDKHRAQELPEPDYVVHGTGFWWRVTFDNWWRDVFAAWGEIVDAETREWEASTRRRLKAAQERKDRER